MTALPPTTGHLQLLQFASQLRGVDKVVGLVCTQPSEPFCDERVAALRMAAGHDPDAQAPICIRHFHQEIEQDPEAPGFWDMWKSILESYGVGGDTLIVASEPYGKKVAEVMGARFMPYDIDRQLNGAKATQIREDPAAHFDQILPEFRKHLRTTVTIFGAESTGKTTLAKDLAEDMNVPWLFEWARPYLEYTSPDITVQSMETIWSGQAALQRAADRLAFRSHLIIQDTDLYSTIGYWEQPHWQKSLGPCPAALKDEAEKLRSDLYLITLSNIPFEADPLRYGGDHRESPDSYWIALCEKYGLPYFVLQQESQLMRVMEAQRLIRPKLASKLSQIRYDRHGL